MSLVMATHSGNNSCSVCFWDAVRELRSSRGRSGLSAIDQSVLGQPTSIECLRTSGLVAGAPTPSLPATKLNDLYHKGTIEKIFCHRVSIQTPPALGDYF